MEQRFEAGDVWLIAGCLFVTVVCLGVGVHCFYQAFPEASIEFTITREQARDQARAFLDTRGLDVGACRHSAIFWYHDRTKVFLERELGLEGAASVIGDPVRLWRWCNRWVRELQKEEFHVEVTTAGELVGFTHVIEEDLEGARLGEADARSLAEGFLTEVLGRRLDELEFVEAEAIERKNRMDHSFTWRLRDFAVNGATYRVNVVVQGDQIGAFDEFLRVPEAWNRGYDELRSRNEATGSVASFLMLLTVVTMAAAFFGAVRGRDIRWRTAAVFGGIAALLSLLANLNRLPLTAYQYDTTDTYGSFLAGELLNSLLVAVFHGVLICFVTAAAEPLYRRFHGREIQLSRQFLARGLRTKRFLLGTIIGLTLTAFFFAYQTLFYIIADEFGAWSPAQVPYSDIVNTYIPWIVVLLIGFMPAVSEEFISRAFSIPFLCKYLRWRWVAVLVSAAIWGFAHAEYPQQPFFIRGLELGIAGIVIGAVFLRWGLLAPLVWHYTIDALYTALILLRSDNTYFVVSAGLSAGLMLLPLAAAIILYLRRGSFVHPAPLLNRADAAPASRPRPRFGSDAAATARPVPDRRRSPLAVYRPLSRRRLGVATATMLVSLLVFVPGVETYFDFDDYAITRHQAQARAVDHLRTAGVDSDSYRIVTYQRKQVDGYAIEYIMERAPVSTADRLYREDLCGSVWVTRFYRIGEKEEYRVAVDPRDGAIYSVRHLLEEETAGADLAEAEARAIAENHMRAFGLDPEEFELRESSSEKLEARRDYCFVFEAREGDPRNVDELRYRCQVTVDGDLPTSLERHLKVPETWLRDREESDWFQTTLRGLLTVLFVAALLHMTWVLVCQVRRHGLDWSPLLKLSLLGVAVFALSYLNNLPTMGQGYDTRFSHAVSIIGWITMPLVLAVGIGVILCAGLGLMTSLYPEWMQRLKQAPRTPVLRDALAAAVLVVVGSHSLQRYKVLQDDRFPPAVLSFGLGAVPDLDVYLPLWSALTRALLVAVVVPVMAGVGRYYVRRLFKTARSTILAVLVLGLIHSGSRAVHAGDFSLGLADFLLSALFCYVVARHLLRNNVAAYVLTGFLWASWEPVAGLLEQPAPAYRLQGYLYLAWLALVLGRVWFRADPVPRE